MINLPDVVFYDFLEIIKAHSIFKEKKAKAKKEINNDEFVSMMKSAISYHKSDPYSWESREFGISSGLSNYGAEDLTSKAEEHHKAFQEKLIQEKISSEKYYKKLKHQFIETHPEFKEQLELMLIDSGKASQKKNWDDNETRKKIKEIKESLISFLHYQFHRTLGAKIAYQSFAREVNKKYNLETEEINVLSDKYDPDYHSKNLPKLISQISKDDMTIIIKALKGFIENVSPEDMANCERYVNPVSNGNITVEEKITIAESIIKKRYAKNKKLYEKCIKLQLV